MLNSTYLRFHKVEFYTDFLYYYNMKKNKNTIIIPLTVLFCVLYVIFAFRPLGTELYFEPLQTIDIYGNEENIQQEPPQAAETQTDVSIVPFKLGQTLGYIDSNGKILYRYSFPWKSSITENFFTVYDLNSTKFNIWDQKGQIITTIDAAGFPFLEQDRIFLFGPGGNNFAKYDVSGKKLWQFERFAPITCFNSSKGGITAGYSDGTLITWASDGTILQNFIPGGSNHNVILGAAVSGNGKYTACISGIQKQRFIITKNEGKNSKIIFHHYLNEENTTQRYIKFSLDDSTVYYDTAAGLGICVMDKVKRFHKYSIDPQGTVMQIVEDTESPFVFILAKNAEQENTEWTVTILERVNHIAGRFSFSNTENAFIQFKNQNLFVGTDTTISILKVGRK